MLLFIRSVGCDSKAITTLLCSRTNSQRQRIELEYKTMYGRVSLDAFHLVMLVRDVSALGSCLLAKNYPLKIQIDRNKFPPWHVDV